MAGVEEDSGLATQAKEVDMANVQTVWIQAQKDDATG